MVVDDQARDRNQDQKQSFQAPDDLLDLAIFKIKYKL